MATTTNRYLAYPTNSSGINRVTSSGLAWTYSNYTVVVPGTTITAGYNLAGVTWAWHTPIAAADSTEEWLIELATGAIGAESMIVQVPCSIRGDTLVGYVPSNLVVLPEPKSVAANAQISVRVAYSKATTANTLSGIKILYSTT